MILASHRMQIGQEILSQHDVLCTSKGPKKSVLFICYHYYCYCEARNESNDFKTGDHIVN